MSRKNWTAEEKKYLGENHRRLSISELSTALERSIASVGSYLRKNKLERKYVSRPWTKREVADLYLYVERYGPHIISKKLNRTLWEVRRKTQHLRIKTRTEVYSEQRAKKVTGYHEYQLQRARFALKQIWRVETFTGPGKRPKKRFTITQKQLDEMCEYLKTDPLKHTLKRLRAA